MDRWQEIINYSDMAADWAMVFVTFGALILALLEVKRHGEKAKIEREMQLIHECLFALERLIWIWVQMCKFDADLFDRASRNEEGGHEAGKQIGREFLEKHSVHKTEAQQHREKLRVSSRLINDPNLEVLVKDLIEKETSSQGNYRMLNADLTPAQRLEIIRRLPRSFYDTERGSTIFLAIEAMKDYLVKIYHKKLP